jgi:hypothetical protein
MNEYQNHALFSVLAKFSEQMRGLEQTVTVKPLELPIEEVPTTGYRNLTHPTLTQTVPAVLEDPELAEFK